MEDGSKGVNVQRLGSRMYFRLGSELARKTKGGSGKGRGWGTKIRNRVFQCIELR